MHVHAVLLLDVIVSATCMVHMHCLPHLDWGMPYAADGAEGDVH